MINKDFDFMDSFYDIIDSPIEDFDDDGVIYVGEDNYDEFNNGYESDWGDDITFIGEEEDEDDCFIDLGEGYIPLPQGDYVEYETVVIDENYVLDEYETDFATNTIVTNEEKQLEPLVLSDETESDKGFFDGLDTAGSVIQFPKEKTLSEELNLKETDPIDDRISKQIAKDYLQDVEVASELLPGDELHELEDDNSWVNDDDLFGNNIDIIIAEKPDQEIEDEDFVEGSFEDWVRNNEGSRY